MQYAKSGFNFQICILVDESSFDLRSVRHRFFYYTIKQKGLVIIRTVGERNVTFVMVTVQFLRKCVRFFIHVLAVRHMYHTENWL